MNSKILLLSIAVISIGLFAMPSTLSLFSGQHTFVKGENVSCIRCHADISEEINSDLNQAHKGDSFDTKGGEKCARCHATSSKFNETGMNVSRNQWRAYTYKTENQTGTGINVTSHAAVTVECLACHGTTPGNYNGSKGISRVAAEIQGSSEAHRSFYYASVSNVEVGDINQTSLKDAGIRTGPEWYTAGMNNNTVIKLKGTNAACIGCHTHTRVNFTWIRLTDYNVTADATSGSWVVNLSNDFPESTKTTYTNKSYPN